MATILTKKSDTASAVPLAADLTNAAGGAELAVNATDKRLFSKTSGGSVVELGTNPSSLTMPNGTANGVPYLNGSKVVTSGSALTFDGTNFGIGAATALKPLDISFAGTSGARRFLASYDDSVITIKGANASNDPEAIRITGDNIRFNTGTSGSGSEVGRFTSTGLGIGTSSPATKLDVSGAASTNSESRFVAKLADTSSVAQGNGGGLVFRGVYTGSTLVDASGIQAYKENSTDGNYAYGLAFVTRANGGNLTANMRLDGSGNLGLGVTPSASSFTTMQIRNASLSGWVSDTSAMFLTANASFDGTNFRYISTNWANQYRQQAGTHYWYNAPSGTAGNAITFTQAMTLSAAGLLGVGVTSPEQRIHLPNNSGIRLGDAGATPKADINYSSSGLEFLDIKVQGTTTGYGNIRFYTGATPDERARIDSSGNLLVGTTTTRGKITSEQSGGDWALGINHTNAGTQSFTAFRYAGTLIGQITGNNTNTSYTTSSDYRLKNTIAPMTGALAKVALLKPCTYKWNVDGSDGEGFIAHELAEVCPQAVNGEKDAVDEEGNPKYQGIDVSFLVATLTAALQELKAEFDAYKASHP